MAKRTRLPLRVDFHSGMPAYRQIVQGLERQAASGRLSPGDRLPTVRGFADELGLNFNTVARAYRLLHASGVVSTQRGRGTYVVGKPTPAGAHRARRQTLEAITRQYIDHARGYKFSDAEIAAMITRLVGASRRR